MECKDCDKNGDCEYQLYTTTAMERANGEYHFIKGRNCPKDWQDKKVEDMTDEQCREAVKELREKLLTKNKSAEENMVQTVLKDHADASCCTYKTDSEMLVNHPKHYNRSIECIDEMIAVFGIEVVKHFCLCNVWKYRYRASDKNGQEDLDKSDWYMKKYMELSGEPIKIREK